MGLLSTPPVVVSCGFPNDNDEKTHFSGRILLQISLREILGIKIEISLKCKGCI